jgi:iron(III) transport system ATP-binding protein
MSGEALMLDGVTRFYGGRAVVNSVSLAVPGGKVTAMLGASGSGKSTLLRLIAGLERVDAGAISIGGAPLSGPGIHVAPEARRIGMVFQDFALFPHLDAAANVAFGLTQTDKAERRRVALAWLARVGLERRAGAFPHQLSGGEQQRVALARALAPQPRAILLDEPFSGLDPALRGELRETALTAIAEAGATAVFVTHDSDEALYVADHLAVMNAGRLVQAGPPREIYERPSGLDAAAALGPVNRLEPLVVAGGRVETPFGPALAPGVADGVRVRLVARPEAVMLTPGSAAEVLQRRPQGGHDIVRVAAGGVVWSGVCRAANGPQPGGRTGITLAAAGVFVFPLE